MKPEDNKIKKKKNETKSIDQGKLITEPKPEIGYGLRVRNNNSARKTIRL
jgi:hypothetical protein